MAALLTLMVVVAVIFAVTGDMNPPQNNTDGRYASVIYKTPQCGCCGGFIRHLERYGVAVEVVNVDDICGFKTF